MKIIKPMVIMIVDKIIAPVTSKYNFALLSGSLKNSSKGSLFNMTPPKKIYFIFSKMITLGS